MKMVHERFFQKVLLICLFVFYSGTFIQAQQAKYVFFFVGDGMGLAHVAVTEAYMEATATDKDVIGVTFTDFPVFGVSTTHAYNRFITGSAAAGTALATGHKTSINSISMDPSKSKPVKTIAEQARDDGYKVGIISSVSIDHATPACFYAHQPKRGMYHEIAMELPESNFDFFGGGGFKNPLGDGDVSVYDVAKEKGYIISQSRKSFDKLKKGDQKVIAMGSVLEPSGAMRYAIDQDKNDIPLEDIVEKAIELLDNDKGFFIMCEEGKIDWAAHSNDGRAIIDNVISLSKSVDEAMEFYREHPDETLIVITADHETGGLSMGYATSKYKSDYASLAAQEVSSQTFTDIADSLFAEKRNQNLGFAMQLVEDYFGLGGTHGFELSDYEQKLLEDAYWVSVGSKEVDKEEAYIKYGGSYPLAVTATRILNNKAGLAFSTWSHTGIPVPVYAIGAGAEAFDGYYDNTDIPKKIAKAMGITLENNHSNLN